MKGLLEGDEAPAPKKGATTTAGKTAAVAKAPPTRGLGDVLKKLQEDEDTAEKTERMLEKAPKKVEKIARKTTKKDEKEVEVGDKETKGGDKETKKVKQKNRMAQ